MGGAEVVRDIRALVGDLTDDEAALVRTLTPADLTEGTEVEHLFELVDLLANIRHDEAVAEYVYGIAPGWDGTVAALLLAARVTTAVSRHQLARLVPASGPTVRTTPARRTRGHRVPARVG
jgi:hypothetical protein